jgi:integrative and conjugative element protein (TIGR02256 family)
MSSAIINECMRFETSGLTQNVFIQRDVIRHIDCHRQKSYSCPEKGGQLFGRVESKKILIQSASGPYSNDYCTRYSYRSSPPSAQKEILNQFNRGQIYLGEWHTHPETRPRPSQADLSTIFEIEQCSRLNLNGIFMLIAGNGHDPSIDFLAFLSGENQYVFKARDNKKGTRH